MGFMDKLAMVTNTPTFSLKAKNYGDKLIAEENVFLMECYTFASKGIIGRVKNHVAFSYNSATTNNPPPDKTSDTFTMSHSWMRIFDGIGCKTFMLKDYNYSDIPENEEYKLYGIINALLELIRSDLKSLNVPEMRSIRVSAEKSMDYRYNYIRTPKVVKGTITVSYVYNTTNRYKSI